MGDPEKPGGGGKMIDLEERSCFTYKKHGAIYELSYTYYYYDDPFERQGGSGVKSLTLTIKKGSHEFGEIDIATLSKKHQADLKAEAESDAEKFKED